MIRKLLFYFIIFLLLAPMMSCDKDDPIPAPEVTKARRTVLVYMVATNSLGSNSNHYDRNDLEEMQRAVDAGDLGTDGRLLVYRCAYNETPSLLEITPNEVVTLCEYSDEISSVDSRRMLAVFDDMRRLAPAHDYGLVLWSHASGWLQDGIEDELSSKDMKSFGIDYGKRMNISTLANTLNGQGFSFVYMDCCFMAAVEVAYELRHATSYIAASATELPANGMDYSLNIKEFFSPGEANLLQACQNTFGIYDALAGSSRTCTMSLIRTEGLDELAAATRAIMAEASPTLPSGYYPQQFMTERKCYHYDMASYIGAICRDEEKMERWNRALAATVEYAAATPQIWGIVPIKYHCGLSIYILQHPEDADTKNYSSLEWYNDVTSALFQ